MAAPLPSAAAAGSPDAEGERAPPRPAVLAQGEGFGPDSAELVDALATLLGHAPGTGGERVRRLFAGRALRELARFSPARLGAELGLAPGTARRLGAAFLLARHVHGRRPPARPRLRSARSVYEIVRDQLEGREEERFLSLLLDAKHALRRTVEVTRGTLTSSLVHPREVFREAVREAAAALVVAHNHPSGDPEPSREDLDVSRRLIAAGKLIGIPVLDHLVVGDGSFVSLRERMDF